MEGCPKGDWLWPNEGVDDWNSPDDWVPPNVVPNGLDPVAAAEPKVEEPKAGVLVPPKREEELNEGAAADEGVPKMEGVVVVAPKEVEEPNGEEEAEPKRGVVLDPNPVDPKVGVLVFGPNGFEGVEDEKGLVAAVCPNAPVAPNGLCCVGAVWPNAPTGFGFGPPKTYFNICKTTKPL